jgi:hypothetical protein
MQQAAQRTASARDEGLRKALRASAERFGGLYITSPSARNTVRLYLRQGCFGYCAG